MANHAWGTYHWARSANPFTLKLGNDLSSTWTSYLSTTSSDWSLSSVLDTTIVPGRTTAKNCRPTLGQVEVCNYGYGNNRWLGVASIWVNSSSHITQGTVRVNDTYFNTPSYNKPAWKNLVMCQEVGHTFGLDHQDENFTNPNLGTCMDYTNDPDGTIYGQLSNEHPNQHDYDELGIIYNHLDTTNTVSRVLAKFGLGFNKDTEDSQEANLDDTKDWGNEVKKDSKKHSSLFERDLGGGQKVFTFVVWAN